MGNKSKYFHIVSIINIYLNSHAIFSDVQATIGDSCVIGDSSLMPYPYKAYVETLLNYSNEYKENVLRCLRFLSVN